MFQSHITYIFQSCGLVSIRYSCCCSDPHKHIQNEEPYIGIKTSLKGLYFQVLFISNFLIGSIHILKSFPFRMSSVLGSELADVLNSSLINVGEHGG